MNISIHLHGLSFDYGKKKALNDVSLDLNKGVIYGLWGRNGAGKTTLMKVLTGLLKSQCGTIEVFGGNPYENQQVLRHICFIQENHPLNPQWKVQHALNVSKCFYGNWDAEKAKLWLDRFNLTPSVKIKTLSKGMRTALSVVIGMASNSSITIFDEPTNGLDAATREIFYKGLLEEHQQSNDRTFIISTHYITEWEKMIGNLVVLHEGRILMNEELSGIQTKSSYISGPVDILGSWANHNQVLESTSMGQIIRLMVEEDLLKQITSHHDSDQLTTEAVPLQEYLLRKTELREEVSV